MAVVASRVPSISAELRAASTAPATVPYRLRFMPHREERSFSIELSLIAEFDDTYEGDEDGFAWFERFESQLKPALTRAVIDALKQDGRFNLRAAPRGKDPERTLELELRFKAR